MKLMTLDLSKRSAGLGGWDGKSALPVLISKQLGSHLTGVGMTCGRLHGVMNDLNMVIGGVDAIYCEEPLPPEALRGHTSYDILLVLYGLYTHAASYAAAKGIRFHGVSQMVWRRFWYGPMKRGTKSVTLKPLAMERARQLGASPVNDDEAESFGIMDYACEREGIIPPWRANEVLRPPLGSPPLIEGVGA